MTNFGSLSVEFYRLELKRHKEQRAMAKNGPKGGGRKGAVTDRTQFKHPNGNFVKRDRTTGQFMDQKTSSGSFKGVVQEPDKRQD